MSKALLHNRDRDRPVRAAGAVLWQHVGDGGAPYVAVVHRPRYDDWSLPKGKLDSGETEPMAAVREVREETGYRALLGRRLAEVRYSIGATTKRVSYWAARIHGGEFTPNEEVDQLLWLSVREAMAKVSYDLDRKVLRQFAGRPVDTDTVLVVRHGRAGDKQRFRGEDRARPLDKVGRAQAESLAPLLLAFGASHLHAADKVRCSQTLEPLAQELGASIGTETALTAETYADDRRAGRHRMLDIAAGGTGRALCTQGEVIPDLIGWWCERDGVRPDKSRNRKGSVWALSLAGGSLVAADHYPSALPTAP